ncbi:unnamed protein product [Angiostrongylus costaricensis]|uniref:ShKT domain-containing protein n=1 Tax=Angiostrongylus costaricensis TaxID=334426 RepID=A0A3P7JS36_ANGCS|nr:unnamed protein product [Angiostrongylus costaricensis]
MKFRKRYYRLRSDGCRDFDSNCRDWVATSARSCSATDYIVKSCRRSCGLCGLPERSHAFAWSINEKDELHSESGYISVKPNTQEAALTTVMNNGFVTVEEGPIKSSQIRFRLKDVGRISFSRDLPVHDLIREWTLLDKNTLQARLSMETLTHGMQEHTFIRYHKIAP